MIIVSTIMKFTILDAHARHNHSSSKYQYLDDLLDKTFITDYFLDRAPPVEASASSASKSEP